MFQGFFDSLNAGLLVPSLERCQDLIVTVRPIGQAAMSGEIHVEQALILTQEIGVIGIQAVVMGQRSQL